MNLENAPVSRVGCNFAKLKTSCQVGKVTLVYFIINKDNEVLCRLIHPWTVISLHTLGNSQPVIYLHPYLLQSPAQVTTEGSQGRESTNTRNRESRKPESRRASLQKKLPTQGKATVGGVRGRQKHARATSDLSGPTHQKERWSQRLKILRSGKKATITQKHCQTHSPPSSCPASGDWGPKGRKPEISTQWGTTI